MSESNVKYTEAEELDFLSRGRPGKIEIVAS
jgi:malate dehydrogenase (oxaloacetate-decarboxylating)(NADP+)